MTTTKALWEKEVESRVTPAIKLPNGHGKRVACIGGCGNLVTHQMGECRKCRKSRMHKGLKQIKKMEKSNGK